MLIVPLQPVPSQHVKTTLSGQIVNLDVYQRRYGLYVNVYVNGVLEVGAVICQNLNRIIRNRYLNELVGFSGDFVFVDTQGSDDPTFQGLGTRFQLAWLSTDELAAVGLSG